MTIELDTPSLDLLGAMHLGCRAMFMERDDGGLWLMRPRLVAMRPGKKQLTGSGPPRQADITFGGRHDADRDTGRRIDKWTGPEREHLLDDGLRLIRAGLAIRDGDELVLTAAGHGAGEARHGPGIDLDYNCEPVVPQAATPPAIELVDIANRVAPYPRIACGNELRIERDERFGRLILSVTSGSQKLSSHLAFGAARTMIAMLGDAGKSANPVQADFDDLILPIHDKARPATIRIPGEWSYADIPLPAPLHRLLREYIRENVKADGDGIVMRPIDISWHSFDATGDQIVG